jgi:hypothetical protein
VVKGKLVKMSASPRLHILNKDYFGIVRADSKVDAYTFGERCEPVFVVTISTLNDAKIWANLRDFMARKEGAW